MDLTQIPKSFWHALSFAVVALTLGLLVFGYRSATISIEIANTKIGLNQAVSETERLNEELQRKAELLQQAKAELEVQIEQLNAEIARLNRTPAGTDPERPAPIRPSQVTVENVEIPREALIRNKGYIDSIKENLLDVRQAQVPPR